MGLGPSLVGELLASCRNNLSWCTCGVVSCWCVVLCGVVCCVVWRCCCCGVVVVVCGYPNESPGYSCRLPAVVVKFSPL